MNEDDLPRLFATLRYAGELGETHGKLLWRLSKDWAPGVSAASLDGNVSHSEVSDPTGHSALEDRPADLHAELKATLERIEADSNRLKGWIVGMVTTERPSSPDEEWCRNHMKVNLHEPRFRGDLCRRCYDISRDARFKGLVPPPALMRHWQSHSRTSDTVVEDLMGDELERRKSIRAVDANIARARPQTRRSA